MLLGMQPAVDIHTHIIPKELPAWAERFSDPGFLQAEALPHGCLRLKRHGKAFRDVGPNCWDPEVRIAECDRHHVDHQVLSTIPVLFNYAADAGHCLEVARYLNDHIAELVSRYPARFSGLGTLPMQDPERAIAELERCMAIGLSGVQIGSHVGDWNLSAPELFPVFEAAERLSAAVFVHPWDMMGQERMQRYWLPWLVGMPAEGALAICSLIFGGVLERLPSLRIAFAHGGGSFAATLGRIEHGFQCRPDLVAVDNPRSPRDYLGRFYVDSLVHDPAMLKHLVELFGEQRVALGTDYPFPLGEDIPGALIDACAFSERVRQALRRDNAFAWLGRTDPLQSQ